MPEPDPFADWFIGPIAGRAASSAVMPGLFDAWLHEEGVAGVRVHRNQRSPWRIVAVGIAPR